MKKIKGFTLIELMIILAIIGMLLAIAIPQFKALKERQIQKMEETVNKLDEPKKSESKEEKNSQTNVDEEPTKL